MYIICQFISSILSRIRYQKGLCPESEKVFEQIITLPVYPLLKDEEIEYVCNKLVILK